MQSVDIIDHSTGPIERLDPTAWDIRTLHPVSISHNERKDDSGNPYLIPRLGEREQRAIPLLMHALRPLVLGGWGGFDPRDSIGFRTLDELFDKLGLELGA